MPDPEKIIMLLNELVCLESLQICLCVIWILFSASNLFFLSVATCHYYPEEIHKIRRSLSKNYNLTEFREGIVHTIPFFFSWAVSECCFPIQQQERMTCCVKPWMIQNLSAPRGLMNWSCCADWSWEGILISRNPRKECTQLFLDMN